MRAELGSAGAGPGHALGDGDSVDRIRVRRSEVVRRWLEGGWGALGVGKPPDPERRFGSLLEAPETLFKAGLGVDGCEGPRRDAEDSTCASEMRESCM